MIIDFMMIRDSVYVEPQPNEYILKNSIKDSDSGTLMHDDLS